MRDKLVYPRNAVIERMMDVIENLCDNHRHEFETHTRTGCEFCPCHDNHTGGCKKETLRKEALPLLDWNAEPEEDNADHAGERA